MEPTEVRTDPDEDAFRALFTDWFDDVWRFARRRCGSGADADDVAAETFAVAWRRRADHLPCDEARLWLFGAARLVLANHHRSERRRSGLTDRVAAVPPTPSVDPADLVVDGDQGLGAALAALSTDDRDLLVMRAWDELAVTEIAVLLECTPNAVSVRLTKARRRLSEALAEPDPTSPKTDAGRGGHLGVEPPSTEGDAR